MGCNGPKCVDEKKRIRVFYVLRSRVGGEERGRKGDKSFVAIHVVVRDANNNIYHDEVFVI